MTLVNTPPKRVNPDIPAPLNGRGTAPIAVEPTEAGSMRRDPTDNAPDILSVGDLGEEENTEIQKPPSRGQVFVQPAAEPNDGEEINVQDEGPAVIPTPEMNPDTDPKKTLYEFGDPRNPSFDDDEEPTVAREDHGQHRLVTFDENPIHHPVPQDSIDEPTIEETVPRTPKVSFSPLQNAVLRVIEGPNKGRILELKGHTVCVGRSLDNELVLEDIAVSRRHFTLTFDGSRYRLQDSSSGNGTTINGQIETGHRLLQPGDLIEIGKTRMAFDFNTPGSGEGITPVDNQLAHNGDFSTEGIQTVGGKGQDQRGNPELAVSGDLRQVQRHSRAPENLQKNPRLYARPAPPPYQAPHQLLQAPMAMTGQVSNLRPWPEANPQLSQTWSPSHSTRQPFKLATVMWIAVIALTVGASLTAIFFDDSPAAITADASLAKVPATKPIGDKSKSVAPTPITTVSEEEKDGDSDTVITTTSPKKETVTTPAPTPEEKTAIQAPEKKISPERKVKNKSSPAIQPKAKKAKKRFTSKTTRKKPLRTATRTKRTRRPPKKRFLSRSKMAQVFREARMLYNDRQFNQSAKNLRAGAEKSDEETARKMRNLATNYETVGFNIRKGVAAQRSKPTRSLAAYLRALRLDRRIGGGQAQFVRAQLAEVAPDAAMRFFALGRFEAAKKAADTALNYGSGTHKYVTMIRKKLEQRSAEFYRLASKMKKSKRAEAKKLLRRVVGMVQDDSPNAIKARRLLQRWD